MEAVVLSKVGQIYNEQQTTPLTKISDHHFTAIAYLCLANLLLLLLFQERRCSQPLLFLLVFLRGTLGNRAILFNKNQISIPKPHCGGFPTNLFTTLRQRTHVSIRLVPVHSIFT